MSALTPDQIHVMQHGLGINRAGRAYRNHYITHEDNPRAATWRELIAMGFATVEPHSGMALYRVTESGRTALAASTVASTELSTTGD